MPESIVAARSLHKTFPNAGGGDAIVLLDDLSLELAAGDTVAITGASGCGKSTLLNLLGTLDTPDSGSIEIMGERTDHLKEKALARIRSEMIGFVFQLHHLLPQLSALENVLLPTLARRDPAHRREVRERAENLLAAVGLSDRLCHRPDQLSGGERQRTAVARALINTPRLLLADEPTGALDERNAEGVVALLTQLALEDGLALVTVTHDPEVASQMETIFRLSGGKLSALNPSGSKS